MTENVLSLCFFGDLPIFPERIAVGNYHFSRFLHPNHIALGQAFFVFARKFHDDSRLTIFSDGLSPLDILGVLDSFHNISQCCCILWCRVALLVKDQVNNFIFFQDEVGELTVVLFLKVAEDGLVKCLVDLILTVVRSFL
jgi:hypothetical protein